MYNPCDKNYAETMGITIIEGKDMQNEGDVLVKDSIDDEKVSRQKQFDRFCYYLGGVKQLLDKKAA